MFSLGEVLASRSYPGRGCLAARTTTGTLAFAYFLTGRSPASRSRELRVSFRGDVEVADTSGVAEADTLRHYVACARRNGWLVVGNGGQVAPLAEALADGLPALTAWQEHTYEPDPPIFTPRVWLVHERGGSSDCILGCARRSIRGDGSVDRMACLIDRLSPGTGVLLTTYDGTSAHVRVSAVATDVTIDSRSLDDLLASTWAGLNPALRVAALVLDAEDELATPLTVHSVSQ